MNIARVIAQWRWAEKLTVRDAAKLIGFRSHSTLCRLEAGEDISAENLSVLIRWLLDRVQSDH